MSSSVSVIVPVYDNESTVDELYTRVRDTLESSDRRFEIVFVNDGSGDGSLDRLRSLSERDPRCRVLALSRNFGQHPAIHAALAEAKGDLTVLMDADLQDAPEELPRLLSPLDTDGGVDVVYTTFRAADGERQRGTSRAFHALFSRLSGVHMPANLGTYRAFSRRVREALLDYPERAAVYGPLMAQMGYASEFVEVTRAPAAGRSSSYTFRRRLSLAASAIVVYGSFLHRLVIWSGLVLAFLSATYLAVVTVVYLAGGRSLADGLTLLLSVTLLMSGVLLMAVGVLTAYTYRIFHEVLARPRYHIAREFGTGLGDGSAS